MRTYLEVFRLLERVILSNCLRFGIDSAMTFNSTPRTIICQAVFVLLSIKPAVYETASIFFALIFQRPSSNANSNKKAAEE